MVHTSILASIPNKGEILVKQTKVSREGKRIYVCMKGDIDDLNALKTKEAILEIMASIPEQVDILVDLREVGSQTESAKKIWPSINDMVQTRKTVIYGVPANVAFTFKVVNSIVGKKTLKMFQSRDRALLWVNK